jgi:DNA polymerase III alpha subunit
MLSVTEKFTKAGKPMGIMTLEDSDNNIEAVVFPREWEILKGQIQTGEVYIVEGKIGDREPKNFIIQKVTPLENGFADSPELVRIRLRADLLPETLDFKSFAVALKDCPGRSPVLLEFADNHDFCVLSLQGVGVGTVDVLQDRLAELFPPGAYEVA